MVSNLEDCSFRASHAFGWVQLKINQHLVLFLGITFANPVAVLELVCSTQLYSWTHKRIASIISRAPTPFVFPRPCRQKLPHPTLVKKISRDTAVP